MTEKKRTSKENAIVVDKVIDDIRKVIDAAPIMKGYSFFDYKRFRSTGINTLVKRICKNNNISEKHVRKVAGLSHITTDS